MAIEAATWQSSPLSELTEEDAPITYGVVKPGEEGDVLFVRGGDIAGGRVVIDQLRTIQRNVSEQYRRTILRGGEILVSLVGNPGQVAIAPPSLAGANIARQVGLVRLKPEIDSKFVSYFLQSRDGQTSLGAQSLGSVQQVINLRDLKKVKIPLPPLHEQHAISRVLGALDDKIEQNRKTSRALERFGRAIFRGWFVDFEPVKAKADGAAGFPSMPTEVFNALPDTFVESPLGAIPRGWGAGKFGDIASENRDLVLPGEVDPLTPYIGLEHMPRRSITLDQWEHAGKVTSGKVRFRPGQVLFGKLRPYFHKVGVAPLSGICSTDIVVLQPKSTAWFGLTIGHASSDEFVEYTNSCSTGTKMPRTNWSDMAVYAIPLPPLPVANSFTNILTPVIEAMIKGTFENQTLSEIRDYLLPRLLKGQVRVEINHG